MLLSKDVPSCLNEYDISWGIFGTTLLDTWLILMKLLKKVLSTNECFVKVAVNSCGG